MERMMILYILKTKIPRWKYVTNQYLHCVLDETVIHEGLFWVIILECFEHLDTKSSLS